jgi:GH24 family phage-related lysozyme (muramidase)
VTDPRLVADISKAEGCPVDTATGLPVAYKDGKGFWTIAWGHLLDQTIDWTGHTITWDLARQLLALDLDEKTHEAQSLPEWASLDTPCRQNAVVECVFNLGVKHWTSEFPATRRSIQAQEWAAAQANLLNSPEWIAQVGRARVARLAGYLLSGSYSQ